MNLRISEHACVVVLAEAFGFQEPALYGAFVIVAMPIPTSEEILVIMAQLKKICAPGVTCKRLASALVPIMSMCRDHPCFPGPAPGSASALAEFQDLLQ